MPMRKRRVRMKDRAAVLEEAVAEYFRDHWYEWLDRYGADAFELVDPTGDVDATSKVLVFQSPDHPKPDPIPDFVDIPIPGEQAPVRLATVTSRSGKRTKHFRAARRRVAGGTAGAGEVQRNGARGTLGGWAWDLTDGSLVLLSCQHVFAGVGQVVFGDHRGRHPIGRVKRAVAHSAKDPHPVDCAIAAVIEDLSPDFHVRDLGPAILAIEPALPGDRVSKRGAATQLRHGVVRKAAWGGTLDGERYHRILKIESESPPWGKHGDSGALVFDAESRGDIHPVLGMHFAGDVDDPRVGYALPMQAVFDALGITTVSAGLVSDLLSRFLPDESDRREAMATLELVYENASETPLTVALLRVIEDNGFILALATQPAARPAASRLLEGVLAGGRTASQVAGHLITNEDVAALREVCDRTRPRRGPANLRTGADLVDLCAGAIGHTLAAAMGLSELDMVPSDDRGRMI